MKQLSIYTKCGFKGELLSFFCMCILNVAEVLNNRVNTGKSNPCEQKPPASLDFSEYSVSRVFSAFETS